MFRSLIDLAVQQQLALLVSGQTTLPEFRQWFAQVAWELGHADLDAHPDARWVELRIAEYTNGHWTEPELMGELAWFAQALTASGGVAHWEPVAVPAG